MSPDSKASAAQLDGTARESVGASVEVAERKPLAEMLREEGAVFRALVEQEIAGIYIIAADGTLAYVNPYFARVFGYEPADVVGRPMLEFVAEPERAAVSERFVAQMTGREPFSKFYSNSFAQGRRAGRCPHPQQRCDFRRSASIDRCDPRYR